jgi:PilZ domain
MFIFEPASRLRTGSAGKATRSTRRTKAHDNAGHLRIKKAFHGPPLPAMHAVISRRQGQNSIYLCFAARFAARQASKAKPMEEKRKHPRTEIDEPAYVSAGGSVMSCMVRNISAEGAAIDIENPAFVPPQFRLVMANGSSVRECRIAWIQQKRIGVTFTAMPPELQPQGHEN